MRFSYSEVLIGADVVFYGPSVKIYGENGYETSKGINNIRSYTLTKKSGSDFYEIDKNNQHYDENYKIEIIPVTDTGKKTGTFSQEHESSGDNPDEVKDWSEDDSVQISKGWISDISRQGGSKSVNN